MLSLRPGCENCNKPLAYNAADAMICSFECTFCESCVHEVLHNVCPNCGGGFVHRPVRPKDYLLKYPANAESVYKPVDSVKQAILIERFGKIDPKDR